MYGSYTKTAGGDINVCRFVKTSSTNGRVVQCGAGEDVWGISQKSTRHVEITGLITLTTNLAAVAGEMLNVHGPGDDEALLELAGTVAHGGYIKSDADGKGVAATSDKDKVGAVAMEGGTSGKLIRVKPMRFDLAV